uniref:Uncharacterized protein n=1 Tax=Glossina pallidipes TaxID=7398 RepID=A0A1A9Z5T3_GLOPL
MLKKVKQHLEVLFMTKTEDEWFLWNSNDDIGFAVFFQLPRSCQRTGENFNKRVQHTILNLNVTIGQNGIKSNLNDPIRTYSHFFLLLIVMRFPNIVPNSPPQCCSTMQLQRVVILYV